MSGEGDGWTDAMPEDGVVTLTRLDEAFGNTDIRFEADLTAPDGHLFDPQFVAKVKGQRMAFMAMGGRVEATVVDGRVSDDCTEAFLTLLVAL